MAAKRKLFCDALTLCKLNFDKIESSSSSSSSSSDSSDDSDCELEQILLTCHKIPRTSIVAYFEEVVPAYSAEDFTRHFRITRELFDKLWHDYETSLPYQKMLNQNPSRVLNGDKTLAIFLWFAAHEACAFRDVSDRFNISLSTVHVAIVRITVFLTNLSSKVICWPTVHDMHHEAANREARSNIPGIIGCVDGTHIRIDPPLVNKDDYVDRKGDITIIVQAVCNSNKKFIDAFIGFPGSVHDSRVFRNSELVDRLHHIPIGHRILGDSAYPCLVQLLTPYRNNGHLTAAQNHFDTVLSNQRVDIEHSFGILKQRFRQLYYCKLRGMKFLCHFIRACIVLHNIADEVDLPFVYNETPAADGADIGFGDLLQNGNLLRDAICQHLWNN